MASSLPVSASRAFYREPSCPVCLEEYTVPKSLPCLHNICKTCLFDLIQRIPSPPRVLRCPICRKECPVPDRDVDGFPTNQFLVNALENSPLKKTKAEIRKALKDCRQKREELVDTSETVASAFEREGDRIKHEIHETVENLVEVLKKQQVALNKEVDVLVEEAKQSRLSVKVLAQTKSVIQNVVDSLELHDGDRILSDADATLKRLKDSANACSKLTLFCFGDDAQTANLQFAPNKDFIQRISGSVFGEVSRNTSDLLAQSPDPDRFHMLKAGRRARSLSVPEHLEKRFQPFAVAVSGEGEVAVVDQGNHTVLLYNKNGEYMAQIGQRGSGKGELECPAGVAFISRHILVVSDGCLFGNPSRIQAFDSNGRFIRYITKLAENSYWFTHVSRVSNDEFLVACRKVSPENEPCVKLFNTEGTELLSFGSEGDRKLMNPVKAIHVEGEFFVSDFDNEQNRCTVGVYDSEGSYLRTFGECMLRRDQSEHKFYPLAICAGSEENTVLAYSGLYRLVRSYTTCGRLESYYNTITGIDDLAVTDGGIAFVACGGGGEFPHSVQVLFHH